MCEGVKEGLWGRGKRGSMCVHVGRGKGGIMCVYVGWGKGGIMCGKG